MVFLNYSFPFYEDAYSSLLSIFADLHVLEPNQFHVNLALKLQQTVWLNVTSRVDAFVWDVVV